MIKLTVLKTMDNLALTNKQQDFVNGVMAGKELDVAAREAGFTHAYRDAYPILGELKTRAYFRKKIRGKHETEGIAVAYNFLISVIRDEKADKRLRLDAAKFVYGNALPAPKAGDPVDDTKKDISEMTPEELRTFIEQGEAELAGKAILINPRPQAVEDLL
jgi:phage terminase small subunit